jgi:hypothetical protein
MLRYVWLICSFKTNRISFLEFICSFWLLFYSYYYYHKLCHSLSASDATELKSAKQYYAQVLFLLPVAHNSKPII